MNDWGQVLKFFFGGASLLRKQQQAQSFQLQEEARRLHGELEDTKKQIQKQKINLERNQNRLLSSKRKLEKLQTPNSTKLASTEKEKTHLTEEEIDKFTCKQLRKQLEERSLPKNGLKKELMERLRSSIAKESLPNDTKRTKVAISTESSVAVDGEDFMIPDDFVCPITQELMENPVITADGNTYERSAIEQWLVKHDTSPLSNVTLSNKTLIPNLVVARQIRDFQDLQKL